MKKKFFSKNIFKKAGHCFELNNHSEILNEKVYIFSNIFSYLEVSTIYWHTIIELRAYYKNRSELSLLFNTYTFYFLTFPFLEYNCFD